MAVGRRKVHLHVEANDPWIDIRRSSPKPRGGPDDDWIVAVVGMILFVLPIAWLLSGARAATGDRENTELPPRPHGRGGSRAPSLLFARRPEVRWQDRRSAYSSSRAALPKASQP